MRKVARALRLVVLASTIFAAGYSKGTGDYAADPAGVRRTQVEKVLRDIGAVDEDGNARFSDRESGEVAMVRRVFPRVLDAARKVVQSMEEESRKKSPDDPDWTPSREKIARAKAQLDAWPSNGYVVVDVNTPNAFVHAMIPRLIFVHSGLFKHDRLHPPGAGLAPGSRAAVQLHPSEGSLAWTEAVVLSVESHPQGVRYRVRTAAGEECEVDDSSMRVVETSRIIEREEQLAMLLSHEISHVIHDHHGDTAQALFMAAAVQVAILGLLDPTGVFSFAVELALPGIDRYLWQLPNSRANETEADATALKICALACYDPREATTFFRKLAEFEEQPGSGARIPSWRSTHPATAERIDALLKAEGDAVRMFHEASSAAVKGQRRRSWF